MRCRRRSRRRASWSPSTAAPSTYRFWRRGTSWPARAGGGRSSPTRTSTPSRGPSGADGRRIAASRPSRGRCSGSTGATTCRAPSCPRSTSATSAAAIRGRCRGSSATTAGTWSPSRASTRGPPRSSTVRTRATIPWSGWEPGAGSSAGSPTGARASTRPRSARACPSRSSPGSPWRLGWLWRRAGRIGEARALWADAVARAERPPLRLLIDLAKLHEHHARDYGAALDLTRAALAAAEAWELVRRRSRGRRSSVGRTA